MTNRITLLRNLMGLSRTTINKRYNIPRGTIQNWESNRYPLTEKGARRLIQAAESEGIDVSLEWLLNGTGAPPQSPDYTITFEDNHAEVSDEIQKELDFFREHNSEAISHVVKDHHMAPNIEVGDIVVGNRLFGDDIPACHMKQCIVQTAAHGLRVRILKCSNIPNQYHLVALNHKVEDFIETHYVEVISAAPIIWLRKNLSKI